MIIVEIEAVRIMTKAKVVKEECEKFVSLLKDKSKQGSMGDMLSMNRSVFQKLQEVLLEGDAVDRKEAMAAFTQVIQVFGDMSKEVAGSLGFKDQPIIAPEQLKMMQEMGKDLENSIKKSI